MATILLFGDTVRYPALRHEVPIEVMDPLLFVVRDDEAFVMTNPLEAERIGRELPSAEMLTTAELGFYDLIAEGMAADEAELETAVRALGRWGIEQAVVPRDLPVALADRLRAEGITIDVDGRPTTHTSCKEALDDHEGRFHRGGVGDRRSLAGRGRHGDHACRSGRAHRGRQGDVRGAEVRDGGG